MSESKSHMNVKGVLVAGGSGSRLLPFTKYTHKTLLPLFDRPVIDYALATMRGAGIADITIIAIVISPPPHNLLITRRVVV